MKELSRDNVYIFKIICVILYMYTCIYHYIAANKVLLDKNIIHHINVVTNPSRTLTIHFLFKKYYIRIAKLYIFTVLINMRNIHVKYSQ